MTSQKTNKKKFLKLLILFIFCLLLLPLNVEAAEYRVIFNHLDGKADDYGTGNYQYPAHHIFQHKGHLFDLQSLTIYESKNNYKFRFSFSQLTDPWGAEFDFSLPLIEVYIDNQQGGSSELFQEGANVSFKEDFSWNKFLKISGWWLRLFTPESSLENILDLAELAELNSNSIDDFSLNRAGNDIFLELPKEKIGSLKKAKLIVLVGSFDPFGFDHFRTLAAERRSWQLYSKELTDKSSIDQLPRVLDILLPAAESQKEVLQGELPEIPYLEVLREIKPLKKNLVDRLQPLNKYSLTLVLLYILLIAIIIYRFHS